MQRAIDDHGEIIHFAGRHGLFPVRDPKAGEYGFSRPGELAGRTPVGWNELFPALKRSGGRVVVDDEAKSARVEREA